MTIVCATRFSEESSSAAQVAAELARKQRQTLWLVHVLPGRLIPEWGARFEGAAIAALDAEAAVLRQGGLDVQTAVLSGKLEHAIGKFCAAKSASLLVVGDTTRTVGNLMATTLDRLAYSAEAPLLVVRDPRPFQAWAAGKAPLKVMLALDNTTSSAIARDWIIRLAKFGDLDLVAARVWWPREEYDRRGLPFPPVEEGHQLLARAIQGETTAALSGLPSNVKVRTHLEIGVRQIAAHLLELANDEQVDIVVLGTHRRRALGRLWSVSHHVLARAPMAVACVPAAVVPPELAADPGELTVDPIDQLEAEHSAILQVMDALARELSVESLRRAAEFLIVWVDGIHHAKEIILFRMLRTTQSPQVAEQLGQLIQQHSNSNELAGALVARLDEVLSSATPLGVATLLGQDYAREQRRHIEYESKELYPLARRVLRPDQRAALGVRFLLLDHSGDGLPEAAAALRLT